MEYLYSNPWERKDKGRVRQELEFVTEFAGTVRDSALVSPTGEEYQRPPTALNASPSRIRSGYHKSARA